MVYRDLVVYVKSLNLVSVNAAKSEEQDFTVTGLDASRDVLVSVTAADPANLPLGIGNMRISADNTLSLTFYNSDKTNAVDPDAMTFTIVVGRTRTDPSADGDKL